MIDWNKQPLRALLFAPGNHPRRLEKVGTFGADAIVLDLEDAVAEAEKDAAREMVRAALPSYSDETVVVVRVNSYETGRLEADLESVVSEHLDCILLPKVEQGETLAEVDDLLGRLEEARGLDRDHVRVLLTIETARGVARCQQIADAAPARALTLVFGPGDFTVDLGIDMTQDATELLYARSSVVVATRAAELPPPIDGAYLLDLQDIEGLVADTHLSRQLGFVGRIVIYPPHVEPVQHVYSALAEEEVERLRRIIEAFDAAEQAGSASIQVDGRLIDYPIYRHARLKLELYETTRKV
jgi:citrate lyase subunit beta/citryl-CoA lyase